MFIEKKNQPTCYQQTSTDMLSTDINRHVITLEAVGRQRDLEQSDQILLQCLDIWTDAPPKDKKSLQNNKSRIMK